MLGTLGKDYVIAIDTDSLYVNMKPLVEKLNPKKPVDPIRALKLKKV